MTEPAKRQIVFDQEAMTLGDMEDFEEVTGLLFAQAMSEQIVRDKNGRPVPDPENPGRPLKEIAVPAKALTGLIWLALRHETPGLTYQEVRNWPMSQFDFSVKQVEEDDEDVAPKDAAPVVSESNDTSA